MEIKCILCEECSRWQPDAKRQEGIRFGVCGMNGKRTERTTICRMPEASAPIRVKRQYAERLKKERIPGGRITPRTQAAYQLYSEGKNYKEIGEIIRFNSMADARRIGGFNDTQISRCCAGRKKQYAGYKWRKGNIN